MFTIKRMFTENRRVHNRWVEFLQNAKIRNENNVDITYGLYEEEELIATGSIFQNILKCIAIHEDYRGTGVLGQLITTLVDEVFGRGYHSCYVYTKADTVEGFQYLGFKEIARVNDELVFLERALVGFDAYCDSLEQYRQNVNHISAIVMNANPFTKGHQYLVEVAAKKSEWVYVFVLSEDVSEFPTNVRKELVLAGIEHLDNVTVLDTKNYMISAQTFPSYFLKEEVDVTKIQAKLDATIFAEKIAPRLNIKTRFVGEEPLSQTTSIYNEVLAETLRPTIELRIIERKMFADNIISATKVRELLKKGDIDAVKAYVPNSTYDYLLSEEGKVLIEKIRKGG